jgi:ubiquinone/menaquinone biosynthesis C-methylase UbiE
MATMVEQREQQKAMWSQAATAWERWDDWLERNTAPVTAWLLEAARIRPGMRTLDLASGAGQPAVTIAAKVAPGGTVLATDFSPEMVAVARRKAERLGLGNVEVREMGAEALDLPDASFDAATMRFGLMFCPDPSRAAAEVRRVLRPGARFALAVWDEPARNPFFTTLMQALAQFVPMPPPDPAAPGPFRLAPPGALEAALRAGGFTEVRVEPMPVDIVFDSLEQYWQSQTELAAPLRVAMAPLSAGEVARLKEAVFAAAAPRVEGGAVRFPSVALRATASARG